MERVTTHRINTCFLEELSQEDKKAFVLLLKIKNKFVSSYIKDYRVSRVANQLLLSRYFVDKYMKVLLENDWGVLMENGDIKVHSFNTIFQDFYYRRKSKRFINVCSSGKVVDILDDLNFMILHKNLEEQEYRVTPKRIHACLNSRVNLKLSRSELRWYKRFHKKESKPLDGELVSHGILGMRRLSELLKCSINSAISFLKRIELRGLIETSHVKRVVRGNVSCRSTEGDFFSDKIGHFYMSRGKVYQFLGTRIDLNFSLLEKMEYRLRKKRYKNNINQAEFVQFSTLNIM